MLEDHEQLTAQEVGKEGCYLFCIKRIAETELHNEIGLNPIEIYRWAINKGFLQSDCLVLKPADLLSALTGSKWAKYNVQPSEPLPQGTKYLIAEYAKKTPAAELTHFVLMELDGKTIKYNPLLNDWLVNGWAIKEYRAFVPMVSDSQMGIVNA